MLCQWSVLGAFHGLAMHDPRASLLTAKAGYRAVKLSTRCETRCETKLPILSSRPIVVREGCVCSPWKVQGWTMLWPTAGAAPTPHLICSAILVSFGYTGVCSPAFRRKSEGGMPVSALKATWKFCRLLNPVRLAILMTVKSVHWSRYFALRRRAAKMAS